MTHGGAGNAQAARKHRIRGRSTSDTQHKLVATRKTDHEDGEDEFNLASWGCGNDMKMGTRRVYLFVYYESIKRELKRRSMYKCRYNERLKFIYSYVVCLNRIKPNGFFFFKKDKCGHFGEGFGHEDFYTP